MRNYWPRKFLRFLASGVANTAITYCLYLVFLHFTSAQWSYAIAFFLGVGLAYFLQRKFVFQTRGPQLGYLWVLAVYMLQFFLGLILLSFWVHVLDYPVELAPIFTVIVTIPVTYLLSARVFASKPKEKKN